MDEVKNVMNDVYLAYKQFKASGDLGQWNRRMAELTKKYSQSRFYEDIAWAFVRVVSRDAEEMREKWAQERNGRQHDKA